MFDELRLDIYLTQKYNFSRNYSKEIIEKNYILVNGKPILKPAFKIKNSDEVSLAEDAHPKYVSRGGLKLEKALKYFKINLENSTCLDVGASTGGFTDCMLQNGAKKVYAVDVGTKQLDEKLLKNPKVISIENTDIRNIKTTDFFEEINFISVDVSFISITKILENIFSFLEEGAKLVSLIKPQFEAGKQNLGKNGLVLNKKVHKKILLQILNFSNDTGFNVLDLTFSPIKGKGGNIEYLLCLQKVRGSQFDFTKIEKIINEAFENL